MKVVITSKSFIHKGGVNNYVKLLIKGLANKDITHFSVGSKSKETNIFSLFDFIRQCFSFMQLLKYKKPDLVHLNPSLGWTAIFRDFVLLYLCSILKIKTLVMFHGWNLRISRRFRTNKLVNIFFKFFLNKADRILVLGTLFLEEIKALGLDNDKIAVTKTIVESDDFETQITINPSPVNILFCSQPLQHKKGILPFMRFANKCLLTFSNVKISILGENSKFKNQEIKLKDKFGERIVFWGYKSGNEKNDIFKESNILVFPSLTEGMPLTILESMASGSAIVSTKVGGIGDIVSDGVNGYFIASPPSCEDIFDKVSKLLKNDKLLHEINLHNYKYSRSEFDISVISNKVLDEYNSVINSNLSQ